MSSTHDAYGRIEQLFGNVSNRTRLIVFGLIIAAQFALIVNSSWRATPDSALYLGLGESIAAGNGYTFNGEPHTFVPPGYPLLVAATRLPSHDNFLNYRVLMALIGFLTAVMGYVFYRRLCGPNTALFLGGLFGVNHVLLYNSTLTLSDAPFALFTLFAVTALVVTAEKKFPLHLVIAAALLTGLPALIRINGLGIPIAGGFFVFCSMRDSSLLRRFIYCALFVLIALAPTLRRLYGRISLFLLCVFVPLWLHFLFRPR
jgi:4-amino-4-deoxy-L-arabinose transferase-like glycosyltransferase